MFDSAGCIDGHFSAGATSRGREVQPVTCGEMIGFLGEYMDNHIAVIQSIRKQWLTDQHGI